MMKGLMDFLTGDSIIAKKLRHKFIFKLIPMLNPDGVIVGNTRSSLTGKDLNRQYRTVIRETYPSIWYTKTMIKRLTEELGVALYCDMHAHSRKHNIFIYGCENKRDPEKKLAEQVFPLMLHKNVADKVCVSVCCFSLAQYSNKIWITNQSNIASKLIAAIIVIITVVADDVALSFRSKVANSRFNGTKRERDASLFGCLALRIVTQWKPVLVVQVLVAGLWRTFQLQ